MGSHLKMRKCCYLLVRDHEDDDVDVAFEYLLDLVFIGGLDDTLEGHEEVLANLRVELVVGGLLDRRKHALQDTQRRLPEALERATQLAQVAQHPKYAVNELQVVA